MYGISERCVRDSLTGPADVGAAWPFLVSFVRSRMVENVFPLEYA